jgi:hypothetical protein
MTKFYSPTSGGFYSDEFRSDYDAAGTWPADAIAITDEINDALFLAQSAGKILTSNAAGHPVAVDRTPAPFSYISSSYLSTVRATREEILNRISGIGFAALAGGDTATSDAVVIARQALLDITKTPAVLAATDADSLKAAVIAAYRGIVAAAPANIRSAFNAVSL